jgi:hypothetical protein
MWEPVGPLPAAVYWRRRWVALATVLTIGGLATVGVGNRTPPNGPTPTPAAVRSTQDRQPTVLSGAPKPAPTTPTGLADDPAPPRGIVGPSVDATGPVVPTSVATEPPSPSGPLTAAAVPSAQQSATSERLRPDDTPRPTVVAQAPVPVPRTGPVPCTNAMLTTGAEIEPAVHKVGSHPVLRLVITNVSGQPCVRDLDAARQEIVVWSGDGAVRLWSSNDCLNNPTTDLRTLVPGRPVAFALNWGGRTTTPGCAQARTVVPAGSYRLMVRLDDLISPPTPFLRTP